MLCAVPAAFTLSDSFPSVVPLLATVALGVLGTGVSFAIFFTLIADVGPVRSSLVTYIVPAFALVYGVTLLHEAVTLGAVAGLLLVVLGSWLAATGMATDPAPEGVHRSVTSPAPCARPGYSILASRWCCPCWGHC